MIDLTTETILTFADARSRLPKRRRGKRPDISTLYRWAQVGLHGIRLETIKIGGQTCTSVEALQRFFDALSAPANGGNVPTGRKRRRDDDVENELAEAGI
jgi:hypothetical protein